MNTCPQCKSVFPEEYVFCMNDGTTLVDSDAEQETQIKQPVINAKDAKALPHCASCGKPLTPNSKFCKKCGAAVVPNSSDDQTPRTSGRVILPRLDIPKAEPVPDVVSPAFGETVAAPSLNPSFSSSAGPGAVPVSGGFSKVKIIGALAVLLILALSVFAFVYLNQPHKAEALLDKAIANDQFLEPSGTSAFDLYHELKNEGADEKVLSKYADRIFPVLIEKTEDILKSVTEPGFTEKNVGEWKEAEKMLRWAAEMRPDDKKAGAKAEYCIGRVFYLNEDKSQSLEHWKKAADLDSDWALPLNGIGLIYNERKDYGEARKWLEKAVDREPNWAIPYNNIGTSYYFQNNFDQAILHYKKASGLSPRWARPNAWLASIAMKSYDCDSAVTYFEKVLSPDAVGTGEMNMATIRKQYREAQECPYIEDEYDYGSNSYSYP